jgi:hypothetical protein
MKTKECTPDTVTTECRVKGAEIEGLGGQRQEIEEMRTGAEAPQLV